MKKKLYETMKEEKYIGKTLLESNDFIHCSSIEYFWRVAPNFDHESEELVLLLIDTELLDAPVKWEDLDGYGRTYPHIYGLIKAEAIKQVLPYQKRSDGSWIKNDELAHISDQ